MLHRMVNRGYDKAEYGFDSDSIYGRLVVRDDHNIVCTSMIAQKLVRRTTKLREFLFYYLTTKAYLQFSFPPTTKCFK